MIIISTYLSRHWLRLCVCSRACDRERACVRVCVRVLMCVREYVLVHVPCHFLSYISYKIQYLYFLPLTKFTCCRYINLTDSVLRIIESTKSPVETNPLAFSFLPMRTLTAKKIEREKDTHAHSQTHMHVHTHKVKKPNTQYTLKHTKQALRSHACTLISHSLLLDTCHSANYLHYCSRIRFLSFLSNWLSHETSSNEFENVSYINSQTR